MSEQSPTIHEPVGATGTRAARDPEPSLAELIRSMSENSSRLVRDEVKLAQAEMSAKAKDIGVGVGAFGAAGVLALFGVGVLLAAAVLGLSAVLPPALAAVIIGVVILIIAGVAALVGKKKVSEGTPPVPERTVATVKQDVKEIKESAKS